MVQIGKVLQTSIVHCSKTNCLIPFKLTAFVADTHRYLHVNFLNNWLGFKDSDYCDKLNRWRCSWVLWIYRNTVHLEILKNIESKVKNERPLGIAHVVLFTF